MRKSLIAGVLAVATVGSAMLGGVALAGDDGGDGYGGKANNNCLNVGVNLVSGIGVAGTGVADAASCDASANGSGGDAD